MALVVFFVLETASAETTVVGNYTVSFVLDSPHRCDILWPSPDNHTVIGASIKTFDGAIMILNEPGVLDGSHKNVEYMDSMMTHSKQNLTMWVFGDIVDGGQPLNYIAYFPKENISVNSNLGLMESIKFFQSLTVTKGN